jgi:hypothetical protein
MGSFSVIWSTDLNCRVIHKNSENCTGILMVDISTCLDLCLTIPRTWHVNDNCSLNEFHGRSYIRIIGRHGGMRMSKARGFLRGIMWSGYVGDTRRTATRYQRLSDGSRDDNPLISRLSDCTARRGCFRRNGCRNICFHVHYEEIHRDMFRGGISKRS